MSTYLHNAGEKHIYEDIRRAMDAGNLVLFAGSGLSAQATTDDGRHPPLWRGLLEGMVGWCNGKRLIEPGYARQILRLVEQGFLIEAGQWLQESLESPHLQRCLGEILLCNEAKASKAHKIVAKIPFRAYVTTNYDDFIEGEFRVQRGLRLQPFYERTVDQVLAAYNEKKPFILKLHGDVSYPDSIVLGTRSYERLLYSNDQYRRCLDTIFPPAVFCFWDSAVPTQIWKA